MTFLLSHLARSAFPLLGFIQHIALYKPFYDCQWLTELNIYLLAHKLFLWRKCGGHWHTLTQPNSSQSWEENCAVVSYIVLISVVTTKIPLVCSSKFEIYAVIHYFTTTEETATKNLLQICLVYSDNVTCWWLIDGGRNSLTDVPVFKIRTEGCLVYCFDLHHEYWYTS